MGKRVIGYWENLEEHPAKCCTGLEEESISCAGHERYWTMYSPIIIIMKDTVLVLNHSRHIL